MFTVGPSQQECVYTACTRLCLLVLSTLTQKETWFQKFNLKIGQVTALFLRRQIGEGGGCFVPAPFKVKEEGVCV